MSERTDANEARYDRMAPVYRWLTGLSSLGTIRGLYRAAAEAATAAGVRPGGLVVDLGCGPATSTPFLVRGRASSASISRAR